MTDELKNSIRDNVLKRIEAGKVHMRPRWHFVLRAVLMIVGTVLLVLTTVYLTSFIIFTLRQTGALAAPGFRPGGYLLLLGSIPWVILVVAVIFLVLLGILVKKYSFGYHKPLLYTTAGIIALAVVGGILVEMTPLHRGLFRIAEENNLPVAGHMYRSFGQHHIDNITIGEITELVNEDYKILEREGEPVFVNVDDDTKVEPGVIYKIGDTIIIFGKRDDGTVDAEGIRIFTGEPPHRVRPGTPGPLPPSNQVFERPLQ
jgi:hypothetical protein